MLRSVVAAGSMSAAAADLGYSPSAVSQHIAALERETGLALFEKSGRGVAPTPHARALATGGDDVMAAIAGLDALVADLKSGRTGTLTVGTFSSVGEHWLPGIAARIRAEFPRTRLSIELTEPPASPRRPDVDIRTEDPAEPASAPAGYRRVELATEPYVLLLHRDHPLAGRERIPAAELAREPWIRHDVAENTSSRIVAAAWRAAGFTPRSIIQAADHHGAAAFVAAGLGVCAVPRLAASRLPDGVVRRQITGPTPRRRIAACIRDTARGAPATARLLALLREAAAQTG